MKKLLVSGAMLLNLTAQAQKLDTAAYSAGKELIQFKRSYYTGFAFELAGAGIAIGGLAAANAAQEGNKSYSVTTIGGLVFAVGWIIELTSFSHIGNAGFILKENGIAFPIKRKHHSSLYEMNNKKK